MLSFLLHNCHILTLGAPSAHVNSWFHLMDEGHHFKTMCENSIRLISIAYCVGRTTVAIYTKIRNDTFAIAHDEYSQI